MGVSPCGRLAVRQLRGGPALAPTRQAPSMVFLWIVGCAVHVRLGRSDLVGNRPSRIHQRGVSRRDAWPGPQGRNWQAGSTRPVEPRSTQPQPPKELYPKSNITAILRHCSNPIGTLPHWDNRARQLLEVIGARSHFATLPIQPPCTVRRRRRVPVGELLGPWSLQ